MFHSQRTAVMAAVMLAVVTSVTAQDADKTVARLKGPVLLSLRGVTALDQLPIRDGTQFGIYRDKDQPPHQQFIKYWIEPQEMPGGGKESFLAVYYNVTGEDTYNGIWMKLGGADWRDYKHGDIVLRLRQLEPLNKVKIDDAQADTALQDTPCTDVFKVEVKAEDKDKGIQTFAIHENVGKAHRAQQAKAGYFDLRIPLSDFGATEQLGKMNEFVLTFENQAIPARHRRGNLGIQAIVLTTERNQEIGALLKAAAPVASLQGATEARPSGEKRLVLIEFDKELDKLVVPRKDFGIYRDLDPKSVQWIEEGWEEVACRPVLSGITFQRVGFLRLHYEVPRKYNGWWLKLHGADWSAYKDGFLVLRLRPGPSCTPTFKLELKTGNDAAPVSYPYYVRISDDQVKAAEETGYTDILIPLKEFRIADVSRMAELVLTFESNRIEQRFQKGTVFVRAIFLVSNKSEGAASTRGSREATAIPQTKPNDTAKLTVIDFAKVQPDSKRDFGVFRNPDPREVQWIEDGLERIKFTGVNREEVAECIRYEVPHEYNGWWLKLGTANWEAFAEGSLVLSLRPGESCTPVFKLELKAGKEVDPYPVYVRLNEDQYTQAREDGFVDIEVPLKAFGISDLKSMRELTVVFESSRIPEKARKGVLYLRAIRLVQHRPDWSQPWGPMEELELDELGKKAFQWFQDAREPVSGLILDRDVNWYKRGCREDNYRRLSAMQANRAKDTPASIAAAGYFLSVLPSAVKRSLITRQEAERQTKALLVFAQKSLEDHHGLFYHFVDWKTGKRWPGSEVSVLDSAIFFNGCMVAAEEFGGEVADRANALVDRANWPSFLITLPGKKDQVLCLGWSPESGLLGPIDVRSSETAIAYFVAVGSRTHPIVPQCWYNTGVNYRDVCGYKVLNGGSPLFTSYFGLGWHDLRGLADKDGVDIESNARLAALANRAFCRKLGERHRSYAVVEGGWWGVSAGDSPTGYIASGPIPGDADGMVWPMSALSAVTWIPGEVKTDLHAWQRSRVWPLTLGDYGLAPFNLDAGSDQIYFDIGDTWGLRHCPEMTWIARDAIGIDLGSFSVNLANHRSETVWKLWMRHPVAVAALKRLEFHKTTPATSRATESTEE